MRMFGTVLALFAGLALVSAAASAEPRKVSAPEAAAMAEAGEILLVDIRTPEEWRATGVPAPAHLLDMRDRDFVRKLQGLMAANPGKPVALMCATGGRSGFATKRLEQFGFSGMIDVPEGVMGSRAGPGWLKRGLPLRRPDQPPAAPAG